MNLLAETIKQLTQQISPSNPSNNSTPYLVTYLQTLQKSQPGVFSPGDPCKDVLIHMLEVL
jgi:hypothetical protein